MRVFNAAILFAVTSAAAHAQHQPYAGQQQRDLKALYADEIQQYLQGAGLGYAKPAELNGRLRRYEAQPVGNYHGNVFRRSSR